MVELLFLKSFAIALALGALIGLEREYARYKERGHRYAGIRTFPLIALLGALSTYLGDLISIWILLVTLVLVGILILVAYFAVLDKKYVGATSEMAALLTFFIGVLSYQGEFFFATILAVVITLILYARSMLHSFAEKIKESELSATLKFGVIAFIVLPFLPNEWYGPLKLFNPFVTWLMVVFIAGISFVGYILLKWFGERGIALTGILGGMVSSTATTTSFAVRSRKEEYLYRALIVGVVLANGTMLIRVLLEVFVVNRDLFAGLLIPLLSLALITAIFAYILWQREKGVVSSIKLGSPFTLKPALKFAGVFAFIIALVKVADVYLSTQGVYVISFLSGLVDVDAITVSLSQLAKTGLAAETAQDGILIAALTNIASKGAIAWWLGGKKFSRIIVSFFAVLIVVGVVLIVVV